MVPFALEVYLSGEIHSDWREQLRAGAEQRGLPCHFTAPICDHAASDEIGDAVLGAQPNAFWRDHSAAKINAIRTRTAIARADVVVIRFGPQYKQWNAAFDAGIAVALGKQLITLHDDDLVHPLKEINAAAAASARSPEQVLEILAYVCTKD